MTHDETIIRERFLRRFYRPPLGHILAPVQTVRERAITLKILRHLKERARRRGWQEGDVQAGRN